ncbi:MAG: DUF2304 domain-containing protein [Anaerolineales bacterium]|nr:DUF2304 domain-containing protein [Anaerolineales bacterium]
MQTSQILIALGLVIVLVYVFAAKNALSQRWAIVVLVGIGLVLAAWPNLTSLIANSIGIGRGTDLLLYVFVVFCIFLFAHILGQQHRLASLVVTLVREEALHNAKVGEVPQDPGPGEEAAKRP